MAASHHIDADWLRRPATQAVFEALERAGHEARVVGGAVRNALIGKDVSDIDIATPALPEQVIAAAEAARLAVVPTGLKHGTVTVISDGVPHEVTTLRHDVETDGRHAVVAFSADWEQDAARRDFTINALYCDRAGVVFDPLGGLSDLDARRVRFLGDPHDRIREDYLRILRFFRFSAEYAVGRFDEAGLLAAGELRDGIRGLSAERVRAEFVKLLIAPRAVDAIDAMVAHGFLSPMLGLAPSPSLLLRAVHIEADAYKKPDPMFRLGLLAVGIAEQVGWLAKRLRLSGDEKADLLSVAEGVCGPGAREAAEARAAIYRDGARAFAFRVLSAAARVEPDEAARLIALVRGVADWKPPSLPVSGRDLIALGYAPGPGMGEVLRAAEAAWIASDFTATRERLLRDIPRPTGAT